MRNRETMLAAALVFAGAVAQAQTQTLDTTTVVIQQGDTLVSYHYAVFDYGGINEALQQEDPQAVQAPQDTSLMVAEDYAMRVIHRPLIPCGNVVGAIPFTEGRTPSGGKTITVPVMLASKAPCPEISLVYNSQTSNGIAGYGWSLSGLSSIRCVAASVHFDGAVSPEDVGQAPFALDGIRLIPNTNSQMSEFQWVTSTGFTYVKEKQVGGVVRGFEAACPDGSRMHYGWTDSGTGKLEYPLTFIQYRNGFRVSVEYWEHCNHFYPTRIHYGSAEGDYPGEILFTYGGRSDIRSWYHAGMEERQEKILSSIETKDGNQVLRNYSLTYEDHGKGYLLTAINCTVGEVFFNPLEFDYGDGDHPDSFSNEGGYEPLMINSLQKPYIRRGRFVRGQASDGLIVMPEYPAFMLTGGVYSNSVFYPQYGNGTPTETEILISPVISTATRQTAVLTAGQHFQTVSPVDIDGNGIDEIVKVNYDNTLDSQFRLKTEIYSYSYPGLLNTEREYYHLIDDPFVSGALGSNTVFRLYYFGDFLGTGRPQMLTVSCNETPYYIIPYSDFSLIDLYDGTLVRAIFSFNVSFSDTKNLFPMDSDGDGKIEFCRICTNRIEVYGWSTGGMTQVGSHLLGGDYSSNSYQLCDMNGDGLQDIMFFPVSGDVWTCFLNTGKGFVKQEKTYPGLVVTSTDDCLLQDMNHDGKSDLLLINGLELYVYMNRNGELLTTPASGMQVTGDAMLPRLDLYDGYREPTPVTFEGNSIHPITFKGDERCSNVLRFMRDSRGNTRQYFYSDMTSAFGAYHQGNGTYSYPYYPVCFPMLLLEKEVSYMSGEQNEYSSVKDYAYTNAVAHRTGLGFCGFADSIVTEEVQGIKERTRYDPTLKGVPEWIGTKLSGASTCYQEKTLSYESRQGISGKWDPVLISTEEINRLDSVTVRHDYAVDSLGYTVRDTLSYPFETGERRRWVERKEVQHVIGNGLYLTGLPILTEKSVYKESEPGDGEPAICEKEVSRITYNSSYYPSLVTTKRYRFQGEGMEAVCDSIPLSSVRYTYDDYGNVLQEETKTRESGTWISRNWQYGSNGRFLTGKTDELGRTETYSNFDRYGNPQIISDYAGRNTVRTFDVIGRQLSQTAPTGERRVMEYMWAGANRSYAIIETSSSSPTRKTYYDPLGRKKKILTQRFDGQWQSVEYQYDSKGRLWKESLPYRTSASAWTTYSYDGYNRLLSKMVAHGGSSTWAYAPRTTTQTKEGISHATTVDHRGNTVSVTDPGGTIVYMYDVGDRPEKVIAPGNVVTRIGYNHYGDRTWISDPSAGVQTDTLRYASDGTSIRVSVNPKGTLITHYDAYGRQVQIQRSDAFSTSYTYNSAGLLVGESSSNGTGKVNTYDAFDRLSGVTETGQDNVQLSRKFNYDALGRLASVSSVIGADTLATECFGYTRGWKTKIALLDSTVIWRLIGENDNGQPISVVTGSVERQYAFDASGYPTRRKMGVVQDFAYQFDTLTGNLLSRADSIHHKAEAFSYDNLNRLVAAGNKTYSYDNKGNLLNIQGYGIMAYADTLHPYRVTSLQPTGNYAPPFNQTASFTAFQRPETLSEGEWNYGWDYNGSHERVRMQLRKNNSSYLTRYYLGEGVYERDEKFGNVKERLYLGGDAYSAPMVYMRENNGTWTLYNIGRDYLGSVTHIATVDGSLVAEYSYDAWGRRRNPDTWGYYLSLSQEPELLTGRGYTGHEALPEIGLINMNARLYDPYLGRFLSPDPYIQAPDFTQNFNRYSYALNNPLKYTDESGEFALTTMLIVGGITAAIFGVGNLAAHAIRQDNLGNGNWAKYLFSGAFAGFVVGSLGYLGFSGLTALSEMSGFMGAAGRFTLTGTKVIAGLNAASTVTSILGGAIHSGWNGVANAGKIILGNFYLDENKTFFGQVWEGVSRHTWEAPQQAAGFFWSGIRNCWADRVDYYGGATFVTAENTKSHQGITLGAFINADIKSTIPNGVSFDDYVERTDQLYAHEYGHTIQGKAFGPIYPLIGLLSFGSAVSDYVFHTGHNHDGFFTEVMANRFSSPLFPFYTWGGSDYPITY